MVSAWKLSDLMEGIKGIFMNSQRIVRGTVVVWFLSVIAAGYLYVMDHVGSKGAEGYERLWDWQLFFFLITQFPIFVMVLVVILWFERLYLKR